jgi:L-rhamnose isomerase/sugar isomerase
MDISSHNEGLVGRHQRQLEFLTSEVNVPSSLIQKLKDFQIAIPSWALGTGGTRFGRFSAGGEPRNLEEKIADVGLLH